MKNYKIAKMIDHKYSKPVRLWVAYTIRLMTQLKAQKGPPLSWLLVQHSKEPMITWALQAAELGVNGNYSDFTSEERALLVERFRNRLWMFERYSGWIYTALICRPYAKSLLLKHKIINCKACRFRMRCLLQPEAPIVDKNLKCFSGE